MGSSLHEQVGLFLVEILKLCLVKILKSCRNTDICLKLLLGRDYDDEICSRFFLRNCEMT